jgi:heat shock protein beta
VCVFASLTSFSDYEFELLIDFLILCFNRRPSEISKEEYIEFYKSLTRDTKEPLLYTHFKAEGDIDFTVLLYIPQETPVTLFERPRHDVKLYVKRVFISDRFDDILPKYLNFIKGIVDSDDLPLNVSRETLQVLIFIITHKYQNESYSFFVTFHLSICCVVDSY